MAIEKGNAISEASCQVEHTSQKLKKACKHTYIYIYIYIYICLCVCIYIDKDIYIYIYFLPICLDVLYRSSQ